MTHGGEEPALGDIGAFGLGPRILDRVLLVLPGGDVAHDRDHLAVLAGVRQRRPIERPATHLDPDEPAGRTGLDRIPAYSELDRAAFAQRRGIAQRRQIGRPVGDMHPIEQAATVQLVQPGAEQRLGRRRDEQHMAVAAVPGDDIGHVAGESR